MSEPWFDPNTFGAYVGGIGGGVLGSLGGCLGAAAGYLAPRGKGRKFILGTWIAFILIGVVFFGIGIVAWLSGQPWWIWFWILYIGLILSAVMGGLYPVVRKRYAEAEQRKMEAESIRSEQ